MNCTCAKLFCVCYSDIWGILVKALDKLNEYTVVYVQLETNGILIKSITTVKYIKKIIINGS